MRQTPENDISSENTSKRGRAQGFRNNLLNVRFSISIIFEYKKAIFVV
jgi:hypothetical protein